MAISGADSLHLLADALMNNSSRLVIDKTSISNAAAGQYHSLFRATGQPGQGAIPGAAASCDNTLVGAMNFTQQTAPATSYLGWAAAATSNSAMTVEIHDRLAHMGGLSGTVTTAQTVNVDLNALSGSDNLAARIGDSNFSDVQWWVEWYTDTGATGVNLTAAVTYNDGTSGNLTAVALAATRRASFMLPLNSLVPAASAGKFIRDVDTITLSATTGTAGSFGVTATRLRGVIPSLVANLSTVMDWSQLGVSEIYNESCLFPIVLASTTTTGTVRGSAKIAHG